MFRLQASEHPVYLIISVGKKRDTLVICCKLRVVSITFRTSYIISYCIAIYLRLLFLILLLVPNDFQTAELAFALLNLRFQTQNSFDRYANVYELFPHSQCLCFSFRYFWLNRLTIVDNCSLIKISAPITCGILYATANWQGVFQVHMPFVTKLLYYNITKCDCTRKGLFYICLYF